MTPSPFPPARREALITLMDDPDQKVREAVKAEVTRLGEGGLEFLRSVKEHPEEAKSRAATALLRELAGPDHEEEFIAYIRSGRYDIESGCLLLCRMEHPKAAPRDLGLLESMAAAARPKVSKATGAREKCRALSRVIFTEFRFHSCDDHPFDPRHSLLTDVLTRREGNPLSLCLVTYLVALRVGLELELIGLPERFLLGCFLEPEPFYLDCFSGGTELGPAHLLEFLRLRGLPPDPAFLLPSTLGDVLARSCRNLANQHAHRGKTSLARRYMRFVNEFEATRRRLAGES